MFYSIGCHALVDLTQLRIAGGLSKLAAPSPGIERSEFETACHRLAEAGYPVSASETAWQAFAERRTAYAARLNLLATYFASPPTQWIGDRTMLERVHAPHFGN